MNENLRIETFRNNLLELINNSQLSLGTIYYILKDIYDEVEKLYYMDVNNQFLQEQAKEEEKENVTEDDPSSQG